MRRKLIVINAEIQRGESTQTHDHEIIPKSFKVINKIVNTPVKPIPVDE